MVPYVATTEEIQVTVRPVYLDHQSDFFDSRFVFGYFIQIANRGSETVQLLRRHWEIRDETGGVQEVEGEGVVGKRPVIQPGEDYEYNSFCVLQTLEGVMEGTYLVQRLDDGREFQVAIPRFHLRALAN